MRTELCARSGGSPAREIGEDSRGSAPALSALLLANPFELGLQMVVVMVLLLVLDGQDELTAPLLADYMRVPPE